MTSCSHAPAWEHTSELAKHSQVYKQTEVRSTNKPISDVPP